MVLETNLTSKISEKISEVNNSKEKVKSDGDDNFGVKKFKDMDVECTNEEKSGKVFE